MPGPRSRVLLSLALIASAITIANSVHAADVHVEEVVPVLNDQVDSWTGIEFRDRAQPASWFSMILPYPRDGRAKPCLSPTEGSCSTNPSVDYQAVLQRCTTTTEVNCISGFGSVDANGSRTEATFDRLIPTAGLWDFAADTTIDLPAGGPGQLFSLPSAPHAGGDDYYLRARLEGARTAAGKFTLRDLDISLYAVELVESTCTDKCITSYYYNQSQDIWNLNGGFLPTVDGKTEQQCIVTSEKLTGRDVHLCAARRRIPLDKNFYVTVRLGQTPAGWLHGRLDSPKIAINTSTSSSSTTIDIQGAPVVVPIVKTGYLWSQIPAALQAVYAKGDLWPKSKDYGGSSNSDSPANLAIPDKRRITYKPSPSGPPGIEELQAWLPLVSDKATANVSTWGVRTLNSTEMTGVSSCFTKDKTLSGLVTTNATQYAAGPPALNKQTSSLEYQVAAPHFSSSGEVFRGVYHLVMRSDVARCIYGFGSAPLKATVSVIEENGVPATATTNVSESDGWLRMSAAGFTHSAPVIRATLTEEIPTIRLKAGKTVTFSSLARSAKVAVPSKARLALAVAKSSKSICRIQKTSLVTLKKGACQVTITVRSTKTTSTKVLVAVS
ncbi:MAG: hypothetical protein ACKOFD_02080 [Actinomycetota bacterium]